MFVVVCVVRGEGERKGIWKETLRSGPFLTPALVLQQLFCPCIHVKACCGCSVDLLYIVNSQPCCFLDILKRLTSRGLGSITVLCCLGGRRSSCNPVSPNPVNSVGDIVAAHQFQDLGQGPEVDHGPGQGLTHGQGHALAPDHLHGHTADLVIGRHKSRSLAPAGGNGRRGRKKSHH